ncbi:hypothetical protein, partial [Kribbella sp.]|uniref:hypothetical protein n=1 Tax=Kribbella sp. TaxID=1871183 RepID=UPI002D44AAE0
GRSAPLTANDRKLLRDLGVGVVFAGVLIVLHAPVMMAGVLVFTVSWRMFLTYRGWAKEHR